LFKSVNIKLTLLYSALFLILFWMFSGGLYLWMRNSFGEEYVNEVEQQSEIDSGFDEEHIDIADIAGEVALHRLGTTLLILNGVLLIAIPVVAWVMTRRTLSPVQRIHEQQKQFVSDVAHELRTPLSIMSGELEISLGKERSTEDYSKTIESTRQETERLISLSENLLFLARNDQGRQSVELGKVDLTDLIGSIIAGLKSESIKKNIKLVFEPAKDLIFTLGQEDMLKRLFFNIIHNAISYSKPDGVVRISLATDKQNVIVRIADNGIGISAEDQKRIFDRFYRADSSRSRAKGYGLGLPISKSIVELHRGKISLHSIPDRGTTFIITLPAARD
jgi:signal transduction histidine kinase